MRKMESTQGRRHEVLFGGGGDGFIGTQTHMGVGAYLFGEGYPSPMFQSGV